MDFQKKKKELEIEAYWAEVSERFYKLAEIEAGYFPQEFVFYQVKTAEDISLDTGVLWKGRHWETGKKSTQFEREELLFTYVLCQSKLVSLKPYHNSLFVGISLLGTVLTREGETLKLHLDIDKTQEIGTAYPYEWTPDTGSVMYCMPKVGSKVSLYFSSEEETSSIRNSCRDKFSEYESNLFFQKYKKSRSEYNFIWFFEFF